MVRYQAPLSNDDSIQRNRKCILKFTKLHLKKNPEAKQLDGKE
jgi:hypothetical protein